ncbi:PDR/VanB family oxidoreductase [Amycolatopsis rifamycinica]|uniref:Ferredoxin n=1 Tax=Amycolatopsis rifamycinica TaxID=287986 RepID=A0A066TWK8_9PSEU|nr:PDR/VanB family oxidoreductase [Amycolatopsis rifamycinica]KDN19205.1 ferredoxin [Amycolatopsis rifamycinica]
MTVNTLPSADLDLEVLLAHKETIADGVVRLVFHHPTGDQLPPWAPGAHVDLLLRPDLVRQYSLCGDPGDLSVLEVAVLREHSGRGGSAFVHDTLRPGDRLRIRGPRNNFPFVQAERYLFVAGGIGITPFLSMVAAADAAGVDWRLLYGGRSRSSMAFAGQLRERYGDRVMLWPRDEAGHPDVSGTLVAAAAGTAVYCCGPEPLLAVAEEVCAGQPHLELHLERFSPKEMTGGATGFDVELVRSGLTLTVPADRSILEVAEDAGVPVLSSCREGTCGTCETPVLGGVPDHRDSLLTSDEKAANETMMICVSRSCGRKLVLDL